MALDPSQETLNVWEHDGRDTHDRVQILALAIMLNYDSFIHFSTNYLFSQ